MVEQEEKLGTNLEWHINRDYGMSKNYLDINTINEDSYLGPYIGLYGDIYPKIFVMAKIYEDNDQDRTTRINRFTTSQRFFNHSGVAQDDTQEARREVR